MAEIPQDRVAGTLLGLACGDALGAGYEFSTPSPDEEVVMKGGGLGPFAPGEWTDDTSMALCIAEVTAAGEWDLDAIGERFLRWANGGPKDIGVSTSAVLRAGRDPAELTSVAAEYFAKHPRGAAGNGSLMRTAPVALAHLGDDRAAAAATEASLLTHGDSLAAEACVIWCAAIDRAIREKRLDGVRDGVELLDPPRRPFWVDALDQAETNPPGSFTSNGFVVTALQAAYAAVRQTPIPEGPAAPQHLQEALVTAVRIGHDTDTVAAIAGSLLGARWGASAIPFRWRRMLHGWPGYTARDLVRLAILSATGGQPDRHGWPTGPHAPTQGERAWCEPLPEDDGLVLGTLAAMPDVGGEVDAIVSLCRVGTADIPEDVEHHEVWLVDRSDPAANANLEFTLSDAAEAVATLRDEGKRVFLHCVGGRSRTPTVAALYLARRVGLPIGDALDRVAEVVTYDPHNRAFRNALQRLVAPFDASNSGPR